MFIHWYLFCFCILGNACCFFSAKDKQKAFDSVRCAAPGWDGAARLGRKARVGLCSLLPSSREVWPLFSPEINRQQTRRPSLHNGCTSDFVAILNWPFINWIASSMCLHCLALVSNQCCQIAAPAIASFTSKPPSREDIAKKRPNPNKTARNSSSTKRRFRGFLSQSLVLIQYSKQLPSSVQITLLLSQSKSASIGWKSTQKTAFTVVMQAVLSSRTLLNVSRLKWCRVTEPVQQMHWEVQAYQVRHLWITPGTAHFWRHLPGMHTKRQVAPQAPEFCFQDTELYCR